MDGPLWSFLDLGPIRRAVERAVSRAVEREQQGAQAVLDKHRNRYRNALRERDHRNATLREHNDLLQRRVARLEADAGELGRRLAAQQSIAQRWRSEKEAVERRRSEELAAEAALDEESTSDLFRCLDCSSLWLLTTRPNHICSVRRPAGDGCRTCAGRPLHTFWEVKTSAAETNAVTGVARPVSEPPGPPVTAEMPDDRAGRLDLGVKFATELVKEGPNTAVAKTVADEACEFARKELDRTAPPGGCAGLHAIANGLDGLPKVVRNGIAWCATEIIGVPEFPAKVISEIVTRAALEPVPLEVIAHGIRVVGTVSCVADNRVGSCACMRDLVGKEVAEPEIAEKIEEFLVKVTEEPAKTDEDIEEPGEVEEMSSPTHGFGR